MTQDEKFRELITKYTEGKASGEESAWLESVYLNWNEEDKSSRSEAFLEEMDQLMWDNVRVRAEINDKVIPFRKLWPRIAVASSLLLAIGAGLFYYNQKSNPDQMASIYKNDVKPGGNNAILTLASGKKIILNEAVNGELANQSGIDVTKTKDGQLVYTIAVRQKNTGGTVEYNTAETPKGSQYALKLSDGTRIWLNAASSLKYPIQFKGKNRKVQLIGEGYFEVAKDKKHPFIVESKGQEVKVLGTHFNINAYGDEPAIATTLLEGSVRVATLSLSKGVLRQAQHDIGQAQHDIGQAQHDIGQAQHSIKDDVILKPGQKAVYNGSTLNVSQADIESDLAWKNGDFVFNDEKFESIMRKIARWYNIEVVYQGKIANEGFTGSISRNKSISEVLRMIEQTKGIHFKVEGRRLVVIN